MASNNIGKTFEQEFKECVPPDYYLYRLKDDTSGFYGVLIDITDDDVIVEFGNNKNCRIPMQKAAIAQIEKPGAE